jgi:membrane associated rhomboid family serine protease
VRNQFRDAPATMTLCALWVAVFVAMIVVQGGFQRDGDLLSGGISAATGDRFGSVTSAQVYAGQWWRALTATFIHYSLVHLFVNTAGLYQIGPLIESWYGSAAFLGLYAVLGVGGNLVAALSRPWIARQLAGVANIPDYPCGGGSGVLCGLVALLAVVGWRSRSRFGDYLKAQMLGVLGFTAALGLMLPNVDNFGHAGGAVAGAIVGLAHRRLVRLAGRPPARALGVAGGLLIAVAAASQYRHAPPPRPAPAPPDPAREAARLGAAMVELTQVDRAIRTLAMLPADAPPRYDVLHGVVARPTRAEWLASGRAQLDAATREVPQLAAGPAAADVSALRAALATAERRDLTPGELANAARSTQRLIGALGGAWIAARSQLPGGLPRPPAPPRAAVPGPDANAKRPPG